MRTLDRAAAGPNGPVETVISQIVAVQPNRVEQVQHSQADTYDEQGRLTSRTAHKADGSLWYRRTHRYDADGHLIETRHENSDGTMAVDTFSPDPPEPHGGVHRLSVSDRKNGCGFTLQLDGVGEIGVSTSRGRRVAVFHDVDGRVCDVKIRSRFGFPVGRITIEYDGRGRVADIAHYGWYDAYRGRTESRLPQFLTQLIAPVVFWFVRVGLLCRSIRIYLGKLDFVRARRCLLYGTLVIEDFRTYDDAGRMVEHREVFCAGLREDWTRRSYDDRGLLVEQTSYDEHGKRQSTEHYTREFDGHGNWTKEILVRWPRGCDGSGTCDMQNEATFITSRTITYAQQK